MACIECFSNNSRRPGRLLLSWFVIGSWLGALPASGGVGLGATATYPPLVEVGQTNLAVSLAIGNTSNPTQAITLTSIKHTPSCGMSIVPCPAGSEDPGVFLVKGPATGRTGSACAGIAFTIGSPDPTTGEVTFTPASTVILTMTGSTCTIDFFVDVLSVPAKNASAGPTVQTFSGARATGSDGASGTGGTPITVEAKTPHIPAPAVRATVLGIIALLLTGFGVVRLRRPAHGSCA
jgi:hypothetical protein